MPFMQRLTWTGIALHGGILPGYPASHGCVRLPAAFAKLLFDVTRVGLTVVITKDQAVPHIAPQDDLIGTGAVEAEGGDTSWQPDRAPTGPVSIVVSARDKRVTVMRSGRIIGSAAAELRAAVTGTTAFQLHHVADAGPHWLRIDVPGNAGSVAARYGDTQQWFSVSASFAAQLRSILGPGTIVIITTDSLLPDDRRPPLTILEAPPVRRR